MTEAYEEEFFVDGSASDGGGLSRISLNGEPLLRRESRGAIHAYFARRLPLELGTNRFEVVVEDLSGNRHVKMLTVIRKIPEYLDTEYRLTVGVPPLLAEVEEPAGREVKRHIERELVREPIRFHLLERDEGWNPDPDGRLQRGRLAAAAASGPAAGGPVDHPVRLEVDHREEPGRFGDRPGDLRPHQRAVRDEREAEPVAAAQGRGVGAGGVRRAEGPLESSGPEGGWNVSRAPCPCHEIVGPGTELCVSRS